MELKGGSGGASPTSAYLGEKWALNLGYTLLIGALLVKSYRISEIFNMKTFNVVSISNMKLLVLLAVLLAVQAAILGYLQTNYPPLLTFLANGALRFPYVATDSDISWLIWTVTFRFALLVVGCYLTFKTRNVASEFNESKIMLFTFYNLFVSSTILPVLDSMLSAGSASGLIAYTVCVQLIVISTSLINIYPKVTSKFRALSDSSPT